jgi:hypothetical protein
LGSYQIVVYFRNSVISDGVPGILSNTLGKEAIENICGTKARLVTTDHRVKSERDHKTE